MGLAVVLGCVGAWGGSEVIPRTPEHSGAGDAAPYRNLRDAALEYHGPEGALTNLNEIRIGWFGPTNVDDAAGGGMWWAARLAVQEANDRGGVHGRQCRLVPCWAADPWGSGVSRLTRMVYNEQPVALLGSVDSASTHLAEQVVAKANLPLVSPVATDPTVTLAGVPWMFACAPSDEAIAEALVEAVLAASDPKAGPCVLLATTDHASRMRANVLQREFIGRGHALDFRFDLPPKTRDWERPFAALQRVQPRVVIILAGLEDSARLVVAARQAVPSAVLFGGPAMGHERVRELAGRAAAQVRYPELVLPDGLDPDWVRFRSRHVAERGCAPDATAVLTYDATRLLLEAVRRAGPNRARIREELMALSPWSGLGGLITFDGTGQNTRGRLPMNRRPQERGLQSAGSHAGAGTSLPAKARASWRTAESWFPMRARLVLPGAWPRSLVAPWPTTRSVIELRVVPEPITPDPSNP